MSTLNLTFFIDLYDTSRCSSLISAFMRISSVAMWTSRMVPIVHLCSATFELFNPIIKICMIHSVSILFSRFYIFRKQKIFSSNELFSKGHAIVNKIIDGMLTLYMEQLVKIVDRDATSRQF